MIKKQRRNLFFIVVGLVLILSFILVDTIYERENFKNEQEFIKDIGINLHGRVIEKTEFDYGHNYGVIRLELFNSNIKNYDERENQEKHIGFIKNDKAELVFNAMKDVKIGDSITISKDEYKIFRLGNLVYTNSLSLGPNNSFYLEYKRKYNTELMN